MEVVGVVGIKDRQDGCLLPKSVIIRIKINSVTLQNTHGHAVQGNYFCTLTGRKVRTWSS